MPRWTIPSPRKQPAAAMQWASNEGLARSEA